MLNEASRVAHYVFVEVPLEDNFRTALALDLAEGKSFPLTGIATSVGFPKPALSIYLYALPLLLWPSPLAATLFTGALNVVGVALFNFLDTHATPGGFGVPLKYQIEAVDRSVGG